MAGPKDLDDLLDQVVDRESFLVFARALMNDRANEVQREKISPSKPYGSGHNGWQNGSIEAYLECCIAWTEAWIGREHELPREPSWRSFAEFLYAGKYYE